MIIKLGKLEDCHHEFLYELLKNRPKIENISHKKMPSFEEHVDFIRNHPYRRWWIIEDEIDAIGSVYVTKLNEIGIHLTEGYDNDRTREIVLEFIIEKFHPERLLANVAVNNHENQRFWKAQGFNITQVTYELEEK